MIAAAVAAVVIPQATVVRMGIAIPTGIAAAPGIGDAITSVMQVRVPLVGPVPRVVLVVRLAKDFLEPL
jgi:hypothetical protein